MSTFWDIVELQQAADLLAAGDPPLFVQLLVLNAVCLAVWVAARTLGRRKIRTISLRLMQVVFFLLNLAIVANPGSDLYRLVGLA